MNENLARKNLAPDTRAERGVVVDPTKTSAVERRTRDSWLRDAVAQHEQMLVRYTQQFVVDLDRSRDVVQDAFLKLCDFDRTHKRLTGRALTKWLFRVCRNRAIDIARKEKRMKFAPSEHLSDRLEATNGSPDASLIAAERQQSLQANIAQLPANQQEVLQLKFHGGMSYQEIADITGLTKTNVGYLLHTAISKLRIVVNP